MKNTLLRPTFFLALLLVLGFVQTALAEDHVSCRYLQAEGTDIRVELVIQAPPPASVIVIQNLPKGVGITSSNPPMKRFDQNSGEAKWLLKGLKPGTMTMVMHLDRALQRGGVNGEIRYKDPISGKMVTMQITL